MPLDDEVEVRVDGDALAVWLGAGLLGEVPPRPGAAQPRSTCRRGRASSAARSCSWSSLFAVIGSAVVFTWLTRLFA